jgi:hypothetical protein
LQNIDVNQKFCKINLMVEYRAIGGWWLVFFINGFGLIFGDLGVGDDFGVGLIIIWI